MQQAVTPDRARRPLRPLRSRSLSASALHPCRISGRTSKSRSAPAGQPRPSDAPGSIQLATRAAEAFTRLYYKTYDSAARAQDLPSFYRDDSSVSWNGNPFQGAAGVRELITGMPKTVHEVKSYDCHPIPSTPCVRTTFGLQAHARMFRAASQPPSLLVTVSGTVVHGKGPDGNPRGTKPKAIDGQPRVFHQAFMLVPDTTAAPVKTGEVGKYYVGSDSMRFVG
jgi:NTF2-related export protein 1/2